LESSTVLALVEFEENQLEDSSRPAKPSSDSFLEGLLDRRF
jgi:hypothetical protein